MGRVLGPFGCRGELRIVVINITLFLPALKRFPDWNLYFTLLLEIALSL